MANEYTANDLKKDVKDAARDVKEGAKDMARDAKNAWNDATDNASLDKMRQGAADMAEAAREKGEEYVNRARDEADRLYRAGERKAQEVADYAGDYYDEMSDMVRRKPAQALGIAAGVGFLVGLILARR